MGEWLVRRITNSGLELNPGDAVLDEFPHRRGRAEIQMAVDTDHQHLSLLLPKPTGLGVQPQEKRSIGLHLRFQHHLGKILQPAQHEIGSALKEEIEELVACQRAGACADVVFW